MSAAGEQEEVVQEEEHRGTHISAMPWHELGCVQEARGILRQAAKGQEKPRYGQVVTVKYQIGDDLGPSRSGRQQVLPPANTELIQQIDWGAPS